LKAKSLGISEARGGGTRKEWTSKLETKRHKKRFLFQQRIKEKGRLFPHKIIKEENEKRR